MDNREDRDRIVDRMLVHVPFEGWTERALRMAIADEGLPSAARLRFFPGGVGDVLAHWAERGDRAMLDRLQGIDAGGCPMRQRIAHAVRIRIEVNAEHREAVRRALSYAALPGNVGPALRSTYDTVNAIWYAVGDQSSDVSFYTKRAMLAAVLAATVLYWLDDASDESADTWLFVERRLDEVMAIPKLRARVGDAVRALVPTALFRAAEGLAER